MQNLSNIGRVFYGTAMVVLGLLTVYYYDFPYMLIPSKHLWLNDFSIVAYISGALLILAGACIVFEKNTWSISLVLGGVLLTVFCFYFIPYQFMVSKNYMHFGDWENAAKELALASGAFVIAACFPIKNETALLRSLSKLIPSGAILFSLTIISFAIDHFLFAKEAQGYVPSWVPWHLFWMYFTGTALLGSGFAIILKIKLQLVATLLGAMIFTWFVILHVPRVIASPIADFGSEVTSAFIALAYSGIAFAIAGGVKNFSSSK